MSTVASVEWFTHTAALIIAASGIARLLFVMKCLTWRGTVASFLNIAD